MSDENVWAKDSVDNHPCIRVEAYMQARDEIRNLRAQLAQINNAYLEWERYEDISKLLRICGDLAATHE